MDISKIINTKHRTEWESAMWEEIVEHLVAAKSKKDFKQILGKLLSADEKRMIANRVAVLALVKAGKSYSEIGGILWTSPVTISTIKKNFWDRSGHYKSCVSIPKRKRNKKSWTNPNIEKFSLKSKSFLQDIDLWEIIKNPPRPPGIGLKS